MTAFTRVEVDGNDGVGKTTLVRALAALGVDALDRGMLTKATDTPGLPAEPGVLYLLLDAPVEASRARLAAAGKDLNERYHTVEDLTFYRGRFLEEAARIGAPVIEAVHPRQTLHAALRWIEREPLKLALPDTPALLERCRALLRVSGLLARAEGEVRGGRLGGVSEALVPPWVVHPRAVPQLVAFGLVDVGLTRRAWLIESGFGRLDEVWCAGTGEAIVAASHDAALLDDGPRRPVVIATPFPKLAARWALLRTLPHVLVETHGAAVGTAELADLIVDVLPPDAVSLGGELYALDTVLDDELVLVARRQHARRPSVHALAETLERAALTCS